MRPEYDFSAPPEGARASRFSSSDPWYRQAVEADRARWLAQAMRQIQRLECEVVTYFVLARDEAIATAGDRAIHLLEGRGRGLGNFASDLAREGTVRTALAERLRHLAVERNWLVHHSFLGDGSGGTIAGRLRAIAEEADSLAGELATLLRSRFIDSEMTAAEFETRASTARRSWLHAA